MKECNKCFNGIPVLSESFIHYNCCLKEREALDCLTDKESHYEENPMKAGRSDD